MLGSLTTWQSRFSKTVTITNRDEFSPTTVSTGGVDNTYMISHLQLTM
jgi:hypothetical protein